MNLRNKAVLFFLHHTQKGTGEVAAAPSCAEGGS